MARYLTFTVCVPRRYGREMTSVLPKSGMPSIAQVAPNAASVSRLMRRSAAHLSTAALGPFAPAIGPTAIVAVDDASAPFVRNAEATVPAMGCLAGMAAP